MEPAYENYHTDQWTLCMATIDHNCNLRTNATKMLSELKLEIEDLFVEPYERTQIFHVSNAIFKRYMDASLNAGKYEKPVFDNMDFFQRSFTSMGPDLCNLLKVKNERMVSLKATRQLFDSSLKQYFDLPVVSYPPEKAAETMDALCEVTGILAGSLDQHSRDIFEMKQQIADANHPPVFLAHAFDIPDSRVA